MLKTLSLRPKEDKRILQGHHWIYSNEINSKTTPLKNFSAGEQVRVENSQGRCIGVAIVNPNTLIAARLVSRDESIMLDRSLLLSRVSKALALRELTFAKPFYRLVYGDSDYLSGLVVDRFGDYLVVQISTAGMEKVKHEIVDVLVALLSPAGVYIKNDGKMREVEGLEAYSEIAYGDCPDFFELEENAVRFLAPVKQGQKTGWFYDHRTARAELQRYVKNKSVLDIFSYVGGWGVQAAAVGAKLVTCVDASRLALDCVEKNAQLNNCQDNVTVIEGNAFDVLKQLREDGQTFDVVVLDPPAFISRRKDHRKGMQAYQRINFLAVQLLNPGGLLVSASCSLHLTRDELVKCLHAAVNKCGRQSQIIYHGHQAADHPIHSAINETAYLASVFAVVS